MNSSDGKIILDKMARYSVEFVKYLVGVRGPRTSLTSQETALLCALSADRQSVVEVGVYEGATSREIVSAIHPDGRLYLVDPFFRGTRMERWLRFSAAEFIARRSLRGRAPNKAKFVRMTSLEAAATVRLHRPAELIFIDADHSYEAVKADFMAWNSHLAADGAIAFHDSRLSPKRPDLPADAGPVRLAIELAAGKMDRPWQLVDAVDTLSVFRRG